MSNSPENLLLVGCGNLGRSMLAAWLRMDAQSRFTLLEKEPSIELFDLVTPHGHRLAINPTMPFKADVAVLAVKPQNVEEALKTLGPALPPTSLVISVAAGKRIETLTQLLHSDQPVVRVMPNMAASVNEAMSVCIANKHVSAQQRETAHKLFEAIGKVEWITDETLLDVIGSVVGCGPAYVFLLTEELARAGAKAGIPPELAQSLARQTVIGAGALLKQSSHTPEDLRMQVTSKGGMTEAAMKILGGKEGLEALLSEAVKAATERSKQLS